MNNDETVTINSDPTTEMEKSNADVQIITIKAGQKCWFSDEVKAKRKESQKRYREKRRIELQRMQQEYKQLVRHKLKHREVRLANIDGKIAIRHLETDDDYVNLINDLLQTLVNGGLLDDFSVDNVENRSVL